MIHRDDLSNNGYHKGIYRQPGQDILCYGKPIRSASGEEILYIINVYGRSLRFFAWIPVCGVSTYVSPNFDPRKASLEEVEAWFAMTHDVFAALAV